MRAKVINFNFTFIKRLFCTHSYKYIKDLEGYEALYRCKKCDKEIVLGFALDGEPWDTANISPFKAINNK